MTETQDVYFIPASPEEARRAVQKMVDLGCGTSNLHAWVRALKDPEDPKWSSPIYYTDRGRRWIYHDSGDYEHRRKNGRIPLGISAVSLDKKKLLLLK